MTPEDLGGVLLRLALPRVQGAGFIPDSVAQTPLHEVAEGRDYPVHKRQAVQELVSRTWDMLEREGLIVPSLSMNGVYGWRQFSENGLKIAQGEDLRRVREAASTVTSQQMSRHFVQKSNGSPHT
jgi:hypothetical protein